MRTLTFLLSACLTATLLTASDFNAYLSGKVEVPDVGCVIRPICLTPWYSPHGATSDGEATDQFPFKITFAGNTIKGSASFRQDGKGVESRYTFTPSKEVKLQLMGVYAVFKTEDYAGGKWVVDGTWGKDLPDKQGDSFVCAQGCKSFTMVSKDGKDKITFTFAAKTSVFVQDERVFGKPEFTLRIGPGGGKTFKAGEQVEIAYTLSADRTPLKLALLKPLTLTANRDWIAFTAPLDVIPGSALDFSNIGNRTAPAGKHGNVVIRNGHFEFEKLPGVPQRFYGANLCYGANFTDAETSKRTVQRMMSLGYNAVRIHHHDQHGWGGFGLVKGSKDGTTLNPSELDKLDALLAACSTNGLYITTDLFVSRETVPWREVGVDKNGTMAMDQYKIWAPVHEGVFNNFKKFIRQWLTHVNPYTGCSLAEEPALAFLSIINEGNYANYGGHVRECPAWREGWKKWLAEKKLKDSAYAAVKDEIPNSLTGNEIQSVAFRIYMKEVETDFFNRVRSFLRDELKCKATLSNNNGWSRSTPEMQLTREETYDYVDDHFYIDHPSNIHGFPSSLPNLNLMKKSDFGNPPQFFSRVLNKPYTITEFNYTTPGMYRAAGGLLIGSMSAYQDWDALWRFAYSHRRDYLEADVSPGISYFDISVDPVNSLAERAVASLFLRRDLTIAAKTCDIVVAPKTINTLTPRTAKMPEWSAAFWNAKIGTSDKPLPGSTWTLHYPAAYELTEEEGVKQFQGQPVAGGAAAIDPIKGTFAVSTDRTCGGFTEGGTLSLGALSIRTDGCATTWVTSLDGRPIADSARLVLFHITDVQNTGACYEDPLTRRTLLAGGKAPLLARRGKADVSLAVKNPAKYTIYALDLTGKRLGKVPTRIAQTGGLIFTAATDGIPNQAVMAYEITQ